MSIPWLKTPNDKKAQLLQNQTKRFFRQWIPYGLVVTHLRKALILTTEAEGLGSFE